MLALASRQNYTAGNEQQVKIATQNFVSFFCEKEKQTKNKQKHKQKLPLNVWTQDMEDGHVAMEHHDRFNVQPRISVIWKISGGGSPNLAQATHW